LTFCYGSSGRQGRKTRPNRKLGLDSNSLRSAHTFWYQSDGIGRNRTESDGIGGKLAFGQSFFTAAIPLKRYTAAPRKHWQQGGRLQSALQGAISPWGLPSKQQPPSGAARVCAPARDVPSLSQGPGPVQPRGPRTPLLHSASLHPASLAPPGLLIHPRRGGIRAPVQRAHDEPALDGCAAQARPPGTSSLSVWTPMGPMGLSAHGMGQARGARPRRGRLR
jgi:hypothetical protein